MVSHSSEFRFRLLEDEPGYLNFAICFFFLSLVFWFLVLGSCFFLLGSCYLVLEICFLGFVSWALLLKIWLSDLSFSKKCSRYFVTCIVSRGFLPVLSLGDVLGLRNFVLVSNGLRKNPGNVFQVA